MGEIVLFSLLAALYPTLVAATVVMLVLPRAEALMLGFWLGAMLVSVSSGLVIVFALQGSSVADTTRHAASPGIDLAVALLLGLTALAIAKHGDDRLRAAHARARSNRNAAPPKWQRLLREGHARHTFVVGIFLSFPGIWYLLALDRLVKLRYSTLADIVVVVGFCVVQLALIELPMLAFRFWPTQTPAAIDRAKSWSARRGRHYAVFGLAALAGLLVIRGIVGLLI